jgi:hypothetical protein
LSSVFSIRVIGSSTALSAALFASGCSLPSNLRDANVSGDAAAPQDDVASMDDAVAPPIDVAPTDTGVVMDTGVVQDTGVIVDTGVPPACTAATVPAMIAPISTAVYATSFVTFVARAPIGSRVEFEYSNTPGYSVGMTTRATPVPVGADGRASLTVPYAAPMANRVQFVRARVLCLGALNAGDPSPTRLFRVGTRPMGVNWPLPIVERYELDMDADARTDVAIGMTSGAVRVYRQGGSTMHELVPTTASLGFGDAIAAAGDVNGDGFGDLLIGDPRHVVGRTTGRASIYFGTRDAPTLGLTVVSSSVTVVGAAVAALGDLNGDGLGDFAVTEQGATDTLINVFLSPHRAPLVPAQSLSTMGLLNPTAMVAGDVSDDGRADIAIGFSGANGGAGAVLVYRASEAGSMMPYQSNPVSLRDLSGAAGRMGASLAMGSLINDRALELIVGAPGRTSGGTGGLLLYVNPFSRDSASLLTLPFGSPASSENFATSLSVIGDSDSDGATEFLILHPGKVSGSLRSAVLLTEFYPFGAVGGFNASVHTLLTGGTTPTYTRALSASGAFLDINNAGRQALVFTAEQVGGRTLQSSVLTGGGMGMDGTWTASNPTNVTMVFGFTNVIASR